jgi:hypothetical protein
MQTLERIGAGRTLFLTFSVFKASLTVDLADNVVHGIKMPERSLKRPHQFQV